MRTLYLAAIAGALYVAPQSAPIFGTRLPVDVGRGSGEILIADVNQDGHQDIITKHLLDRRITISLGDGAGRFRRGDGSIRLPFEPGALNIGDMNKDGVADLLIAARYDGAEFAGVYRGDGRGGFTRAALLRVREAFQYYKPSILAADINEDGNPDLVTSNGRRNTIEFLPGDGKGGFAPPRTVTLEAGQDRSWFVLADLNGDRHLDIVSSNGMNSGQGDGQVDVALGDGRGLFRRQERVIVLRSPRVHAAADVNGDGHLDVIVGHSSPEITVLFNDGRGRLLPPADSAISIGVATHAIVASDLNGDGRVDLAAAAGDTIAVLLNDGRGFQPGGSTFRAGPGAFRLAIGDLNNDKKPDAVASSFEGNSLTVLFAR